MAENSKQTVLVQTSIGDYRQAFVDLLVERLGDSITILCGRDYFYPSLRTGVQNHRVFPFVKNVFFFGRRALIQIGVHWSAITAEVAVLEYNPRIVNSWIVAFVRLLLRRRTIFWGHVYSRRGTDNLLRRIQRNLATGLIVYTEAQKAVLIDRLRYRGEAFAAPNALYTGREMQAVLGEHQRTCFVYVGRLVPEKKPLLMVRAFAAALGGLPSESMLLVAGDGPERESMQRIAQELGVAERIQMFGHVAGYGALRELYQRSVASLSPGYVGLSITQSLGFGVPMIYSRSEPHAPEIVAAREGWNSISFETDDVDELSRAMQGVYAERQDWADRADAIAEDCRQNYSVEKMVSEFVRAVYGQK